MRRSLQIIASFVFVASLNILTMGAHAMLPSSSTDTMAGMSHTTSSSSCATICAVATARKQDSFDVSPEAEDEPATPFYVALQQPSLTALEKKHNERSRRAVEFEPPPGPPAYIQLAVFRA
jgi:hypothetical protein